MDTSTAIAVGLWALTMCAVWGALVNHGRGNSPATGWFLGLLLGPLGVLIALVTPRSNGDPDSPTT